MTLSPLDPGLDPTPMLGYMPPRVLLAHIHSSLAVLADHGVELPSGLPHELALLEDAVRDYADAVDGRAPSAPLSDADVFAMIRDAVRRGGV